MFDVLWTDPNRELVGERIARKEMEAKDKEKKKSENSRQSISTNSSSSSDRAFGIFGSKNRRKTPTPSKQKSPAALSGLGASDDRKGTRSSTYGVKALLNHQNEADIAVRPITGPFLPMQALERENTVSSRSSRESIVSRWTQNSGVTTGPFGGVSARDSALTTKSGNLIQTLGPSSFITRSTEVTVSPRNSDIDIDQLIDEIHISSDRTKAETPPLSDSVKEQASGAFVEHGSVSTPYSLPQTPPPLEGRSNSVVSRSRWANDTRLDNPDAWKPPHEWECTPTRIVDNPREDILQASPASAEEDHYMCPDLVLLQREIRMMAAAGPELILANLKSKMGDATDAMVYKELEMTKKRWMFWALHRNEGYATLVERGEAQLDSPVFPRPPRILALYETQASASFLAALYPQISITHLAPRPISPKLFPNVQPILVPATSVSAGSRALAPHLYTMFRTTYPSGTFPAWLAVGRLRGAGSTIGTVQVPAVEGMMLREPGVISQSPVKCDLRCQVTRMLWQEVWGGFVLADRWWWEDDEIVQECQERQTYWEYSYIVAVKENR
ncbi:hypothetical protein F4778DRAFT_21329 [Xylariomycetidae sp. FL2044]|nr:hypothetical protein F4778DRAFT_21329 [Xylariomycetidae sp. FL2044]